MERTRLTRLFSTTGCSVAPVAEVALFPDLTEADLDKLTLTPLPLLLLSLIDVESVLLDVLLLELVMGVSVPLLLGSSEEEAAGLDLSLLAVLLGVDVSLLLEDAEDGGVTVPEFVLEESTATFFSSSFLDLFVFFFLRNIILDEDNNTDGVREKEFCSDKEYERVVGLLLLLLLSFAAW